mgnify:FL=1
MIYNTLNKTIFLRASTEQVWAYLTDPDKLGLWFHKPKAPLVQRETYAMFATQSGDKLMWGDGTPRSHMTCWNTHSPSHRWEMRQAL